jgi:GNAT superfamily N-acetyltransferase
VKYLCRELKPSEFSGIFELYPRVWGRPRLKERQAWILTNPLGPPRYWGLFHEKTLIGATAIFPWLLEKGKKAWQLGEVMLDRNFQGQGLFRKILERMENDLKDEDLLLYTLPNAASAPSLRRCSLFPHEFSICSWKLALSPRATALRYFRSLGESLDFLLPFFQKALPRTASPSCFFAFKTITPELFPHFDTLQARFWDWRFSGDSWTKWRISEDLFIFKKQGDTCHIGLWPSDAQTRQAALKQLILSCLQDRNISNLQCIGQYSDPFQSALKSWGFRDRFFGRKNWSKVLLTRQSPFPAVSRQAFDT